MRKHAIIGLAVLLLPLALLSGGLYLADRAYHRGDYAFALGIYKPLAILGVDFYQTRVGVMYFSGKGVPRNHVEAAEWFRGPAENGDARAQYALGVAYLAMTKGLDDHEKAFEWFRRSASHGFKHAQAMVATMYSSGDGVAEDKVQAYKWLIIALDGQMPVHAPENLPDSFTHGVTPEQIAEARRHAREWIAKNGERL